MPDLRLVASQGTVVGMPAPRRLHWPAPRALAVPAALVLLGVVLAAVALRGSPDALKADVVVRSTTDPAQIGATTQAVVDVRNNGAYDMHPRFSVSWLPYPYYWEVTSGPLTLKPGQSATYHIKAPEATAAPPDGQPFRIKVNDAASIVYALSPPIEIPARTLAIVNPGLRVWSQRDLTTGLISPAGWQIYSHVGAADHTSIEEVNVFGIHAARFHVVEAGKPDPGGWSHTGLVQEIAFPTAPMDFTVLSNAPYKTEQGGWPLTAFGVEINDNRNGLLWLLFQPTGQGDMDYSLPTGHHIHVYDVPAGSWQHVSVDLAAIYARLRWPRPARVSIKLFIAAASTKPENIDGYIAGITPASAASPAP